MKENFFIDYRTSQSVPRCVVADDEPLTSLSPVNRGESSGTGSPFFSTGPLGGDQMARSPSSYLPQLSGHQIASLSGLNLAALTNPFRHPITSIPPEITDIIPEAKPPPSKQSITPQKVSPGPRRRGPGRPTKAQAAANYPNSKRPTGHSAVKLRRQMHNDSAMRSRARLNKALEELWSAVPPPERTVEPGGGGDNSVVCRALRVEIAIAYLKKLQARMSHV